MRKSSIRIKRVMLLLAITGGLFLDFLSTSGEAKSGNSSEGVTDTALLKGIRTSDLLGMEVKSAQDENVGKVEDLLLDLSKGRVNSLVISTGGVLGAGKKHIALPLHHFRYSEKERSLYINVDSDVLKNMPATNFNKVSENEATDPAARAEQTSRAHAAENTAPEAVNVDNTRQNIRDRNDQSLTPDDQSNAQGDRDVTQEIRRNVVADDTLSFTAKNIKIITREGVVTLRGIVKTDHEKDRIASIAKESSGGNRVDNQLEVKEKKI
jgi:hyperosmotically inducible periplasmic protein